MKNKYTRTPRLSEIGILLLLLFLIGMGALLVFIDTDVFFRMLAGFAFFVFIHYTYKTVLSFYGNYLELRDRYLLLPGRKFGPKGSMPDNSYSVAADAKRHVVFGDMHKFKIAIDNIELVEVIADADVASIMKQRAIYNPSYSMITNDNEIVKITFVKPLIYSDGSKIVEGHEDVSYLYTSVKDRDLLLTEIKRLQQQK